MLSLSSCGHIRLSRGDTFSMPIYINQGDNMTKILYSLQAHDELYFALMEPNQPWEQAIVKKKYTCSDNQEDGGVIIALEPKDTMCLFPGLYYYQIKARIFDYENNKYIVNSITPKLQFWIEE